MDSNYYFHPSPLLGVPRKRSFDKDDPKRVAATAAAAAREAPA